MATVNSIVMAANDIGAITLAYEDLPQLDEYIMEVYRVLILSQDATDQEEPIRKHVIFIIKPGTKNEVHAVAVCDDREGFFETKYAKTLMTAHAEKKGDTYYLAHGARLIGNRYFGVIILGMLEEDAVDYEP